MTQEDDELKRAIGLIQAGKKIEAVPILKSILKANRDNELAWLWLSTCANKPEDKNYCFHEALRINPNNEQTKKALEQLEPNPTLQPTIEEMRSIPRKNFISKYLIPLIIIVIVLIGSGLAYKLYIDNQNAKIKATYISNFTVVATDIGGQTAICEIYTGEVSKTWSDAIDNGNDFNVAISNWISYLSNHGKISAIESSKENIDNKMRLIQTPISGYEDSYKLLIEIYGDYTHICNQATSPSGTLLSYNQDINNSESEFNTAYNKLTIIIPSIKSTQTVQ